MSHEQGFGYVHSAFTAGGSDKFFSAIAATRTLGSTRYPMRRSRILYRKSSSGTTPSFPPLRANRCCLSDIVVNSSGSPPFPLS